MDVESEACSTADVAQNPFDKALVRRRQSVHVETRLLDGVLEIWPCHCEVFEGADDVAVVRSVRSGQGRPVVFRDLAGCVNRCVAGPTIGHPGTVQQVLGVLLLMKMKAVQTPCDLDAEEEVERTHVLEHEFVVDGADDVT